jgi:hypothetical protein
VVELTVAFRCLFVMSIQSASVIGTRLISLVEKCRLIKGVKAMA